MFCCCCCCCCGIYEISEPLVRGQIESEMLKSLPDDSGPSPVIGNISYENGTVEYIIYYWGRCTARAVLALTSIQ